MITIDGSLMEGGGSVVRLSLGLSVLTQQPFKITNIRANRPNPGLREQHLQAVRSIKILCNAEVKGDELHSKELSFIPNKITKKQLKIKIGTAGSTSLILQTLFLASLKHDLNIRIEGGGTWNLHAPSIAYLQHVFLPLLQFQTNVKVIREGFYPKGGAILEANIKKINIPFFKKEEKGNLKKIYSFTAASQHLQKAQVAERQELSALNIIGKEFPDINIKKSISYVNAICPGSGILLVAEYENTILGYDVVGERGKQSELIGKESSISLLNIIKSEATIDNFMLDQILPFLAFEKGGVFKFHILTDHAKTNMEIIKKFLDVKFKIKDNIIEINP